MAEPKLKFKDTSVNTTTSFLDPEQLQQILDDLTSAEEQGRADITGGLNAALQSIEGQDGLNQEFLGQNQNANIAAINQLASMSNLDIGQEGFGDFSLQQLLEQTPGFQFRRDQGQRAVERSQAARGLLESGSILQELTRFGQGLASQEFAAEQSRLAQLAGLTSNAALQGSNQAFKTGELQANAGSQLAQLSQQAAQQRGSSLLQGGKNTNKQVISTLLPEGNIGMGVLAKAGVQFRR